MREALRYSSAMLGELRTSQLSPQKYYDVYMLVFDQLVNLEVIGRLRTRRGSSWEGAACWVLRSARSPGQY